jgi:hypothetical protein
MPLPPLSTTSEVILAGNKAVYNSIKDTEIKALVVPYGYDQKLNNGAALLSTLVKLDQAKSAFNGTKLAKSKAVVAAQKDSRLAYQNLLNIIKSVYFQDKPTLRALGVQGKLPKPIKDFNKACLMLFDNVLANNTVLATLAGSGYPLAKLQSERAKVVNYNTLYLEHADATALAQQTARDERKALKEMKIWLEKYYRVAKVALQARPDLLESIGFVARSETFKPRKKKAGSGSGTNPAQPTPK